MTAFVLNVVVSIVAALVLSGCAFLITQIRERSISRQYPIAGTYGSSYEDHVDGKVVLTKAVTTFKQRGRSLSGDAVNLGDNRKWRLEGRIAAGGKVYGTYKSDDVRDEGLGSFFLEFSGDRLEGL